LTELCCDLGCSAQLVGVTKFCEHPAAASIEKVGGTKDPDTERIAALAPDLVLMNREENRLQDAETLGRAGLRVHASMPVTVRDTIECVRVLGEALGRADAANSLADLIRERELEVEARAARRPPVRYAYLIWRKPWMAAGPDTYIDALLGTAGGRNVFSGRSERYPEFAAETLAELQTDLVLLSSEPFPFKERHEEELRQLCRLGDTAFRLADGKLLSWHGSHTLAGLKYADQLFEEAAASPQSD
jgi:ABC-type Fe3+-hydroxamate transport system substrate-binding protein